MWATSAGVEDWSSIASVEYAVLDLPCFICAVLVLWTSFVVNRSGHQISRSRHVFYLPLSCQQLRFCSAVYCANVGNVGVECECDQRVCHCVGVG